MTENIYDYVVERLQANKGSWPTIAKLTGMSIKTISKTANRTYAGPRIDTLERLAAFFRKHPVVTKQVNGGGSERRAAPG